MMKGREEIARIELYYGMGTYHDAPTRSKLQLSTRNSWRPYNLRNTTRTFDSFCPYRLLTKCLNRN